VVGEKNPPPYSLFYLAMILMQFTLYRRQLATGKF